MGDALPYPGASIEKDFAWAPAHPVVDAYRALKPMPYDAPAAALAAVLYAVHPDDGYFKLSDPGTISVLDDGRTRFTPAADGKHRYLIVDPGAERTRPLPCTAPWCRPRRRHGPGAGGEQRDTGMKRHAVVIAVAAGALVLAVNLKSSGQAPAEVTTAGTGRCRSSRR